MSVRLHTTFSLIVKGVLRIVTISYLLEKSILSIQPIGLQLLKNKEKGKKLQNNLFPNLEKKQERRIKLYSLLFNIGFFFVAMRLDLVSH